MLRKLLNQGGEKRSGFSLPEVIVAFSVLVLVIVSASNVLATVMRTNADNVNSLVAYGLAQEGLESMRFIRDSNVLLGVNFDGGVEGQSNNEVWGAKLFGNGGAKNFILINNEEVQESCIQPEPLKGCLPVQLKEVSEVLDRLPAAASTLVYQVGGVTNAAQNSEVGGSFLGAGENEFRFVQLSDSEQPSVNSTATPFHRFIHVEPLPAGGDGQLPSALRVSSGVFWKGSGGVDKKVVLTSELTNWK